MYVRTSVCDGRGGGGANVPEEQKARGTHERDCKLEGSPSESQILLHHGVCVCVCDLARCLFPVGHDTEITVVVINGPQTVTQAKGERGKIWGRAYLSSPPDGSVPRARCQFCAMPCHAPVLFPRRTHHRPRDISRHVIGRGRGRIKSSAGVVLGRKGPEKVPRTGRGRSVVGYALGRRQHRVLRRGRERGPSSSRRKDSWISTDLHSTSPAPSIPTH